MSQSQFDNFFDAFGTELISSTRALKDAEISHFDYLQNICESQGSNICVNEGTGVVCGRYPVSPGDRVLALRFVVSHDTSPDIDQLIAAATGLGLLTFLQKFPEEPVLKPRLIFESSAPGSASDLVENDCIGGAMAVLSIAGNPLVSGGNVAVKSGTIYPMRQTFVITLRKSAHDSDSAHASLQSAGAHAATWLSQLTTRKLDPAKPTRIVFQPNGQVIQADSAEASIQLRGEILAVTRKSLDGLLAKTQSTLAGLERALDVQFEFQLKQNSPALLADQRLNGIITSAASSALGNGRIASIQHLNQNHTDFSHYLRKLPGSFLFNKSFSHNGNGALTNMDLHAIVESGISPLLKVLLTILLGTG